MKSVITGLILTLSLGACATAPSNEASSVVAPDVPVYSTVQRTKAIEEIEGGTCTTLVEIVKDCKVTRDQSRLLRELER